MAKYGVMRISDINLEFQDMDFSPQGEKDVREIMQAIERGDTIPPILVSENGYLQDGRHRLVAYKRLGFDMVDVEIGHHPSAQVIKDSDKGIAKVRRGIPVDDFGNPLKKTKKMIMFSNIPIPAGSYIAYVLTDGSATHSVFASKTVGMRDLKTSRKYYEYPDEEIALMESYVDGSGELIDSMRVG